MEAEDDRPSKRKRKDDERPKTRFVRRRAVFGKRGTHRRVELPDMPAFAAGLLELTREPVAAEPHERAAPLVDMTEAYAAFCMLLRAGEWERVEMCRAVVHFPPRRGAEAVLDLVYFLCKVRRPRTPGERRRSACLGAVAGGLRPPAPPTGTADPPLTAAIPRRRAARRRRAPGRTRSPSPSRPARSRCTWSCP